MPQGMDMYIDEVPLSGSDTTIFSPASPSIPIVGNTILLDLPERVAPYYQCVRITSVDIISVLFVPKSIPPFSIYDLSLFKFFTLSLYQK